MNRRPFLAAISGTIASLAGCSMFDSSDPPDEREPETPKSADVFDHTVDMVADAGCDPTGTEPCNDAIKSAAEDDTLLRFPAGTYQFSSAVTISEIDRLAIVGEGDVRFRPPDEFNGHFLRFGVGQLYVENVDVDLRADNTAAGIQCVTDNGFSIRDMNVLGRGTHEDDNVASAFALAVRNPDATGIVKNVVARKGSAWGRYKGGNGRIGIWVGSLNQGTVEIVDCQFEEFGNNGIYASRTTGNVQVKGGVYRNNNVSSIRISGNGSFVDGARIDIDVDRYVGPRDGESQNFALRGIVVEQGTARLPAKPAGVVIRNCDISVNENPARNAGIAGWGTARTITVENCRIHVENDGSRAVHQSGRNTVGNHPSPEGDRWVRLENVDIDGSAAGDTAIQLVDASKSVLRNCRINNDGDNRDGIRLIRSADSTIDGGSIETTRYPMLMSFADTDKECMVTIKNTPILVGTDVADANGSRTVLNVGANDPYCVTLDTALAPLSTTPEGQLAITRLQETGQLTMVSGD